MIRKEEVLASVNHSVAQIDQWEAAHSRAQAAKREGEAELPQKFFGF